MARSGVRLLAAETGPERLGDTGVTEDKVHGTKGMGEESISIGYVYPPFLHFFVCVRGRREG